MAAQPLLSPMRSNVVGYFDMAAHASCSATTAPSSKASHALLRNGYGFVTTTIAPHNPQANGIVERLNRDVKVRLTRAGQADGRDWRPHMQAAAAALCMAIGSRGVSIFELLFGQKPLLPAAARLRADAHVRRLHAPTAEELAHRTQELSRSSKQTRLAEQQHAAALRIRAAAPTANLRIGDVVSITNVGHKQSKFAALLDR